MARVKWHNTVSGSFRRGNDTEQGGVMLYLFTRYVSDLIKRIARCGIGCAIGNVFMNLFA